MIWLPAAEYRRKGWAFIRMTVTGVIYDVFMSTKYPAVFDAGDFIGRHFSDVLLPADAEKFNFLMPRLRDDDDPVHVGYNVIFNGRVEYRRGLITRMGREYWLYQWVGQ